MGIVIAPDDSYVFNLPVTNVTLDQGVVNILVESLVVATNDNSSECSDLDQSEFSIGGETPTPPPTPPAPTNPSTPSPTPTSGLRECELGVEVSCAGEDGRPCEDGFVLSPARLIFTYLITNIGQVVANLTNLISNYTDPEIPTFLLTSRANFTGLVIQPNTSIPLNVDVTNVPLDIESRTIVVSAEIFGTNEAGSVCVGRNVTEFSVALVPV